MVMQPVVSDWYGQYIMNEKVLLADKSQCLATQVDSEMFMKCFGCISAVWM